MVRAPIAHSRPWPPPPASPSSWALVPHEPMVKRQRARYQPAFDIFVTPSSSEDRKDGTECARGRGSRGRGRQNKKPQSISSSSQPVIASTWTFAIPPIFHSNSSDHQPHSLCVCIKLRSFPGRSCKYLLHTPSSFTPTVARLLQCHLPVHCYHHHHLLLILRRTYFLPLYPPSILQSAAPSYSLSRINSASIDQFGILTDSCPTLLPTPPS